MSLKHSRAHSTAPAARGCAADRVAVADSAHAVHDEQAGKVYASRSSRHWQMPRATGTASEVAFHESVTKLKGVIQQFRLAATDAQRTAATQTLDEARRALYLILAD